MTWTTYALAMLLFNVAGIVLVYALQRLQGVLPLNPQGFAAPSPDLSWNTAVSFATNTDWQSYGGETTLGYLTQMLGLAVQNFVCAASGIAVLVVLVRGIARKTTTTLGNFWVDLTRSTLYMLLPLSIVLAIFFVSQGVVQTFAPVRARVAAPVGQGRRTAAPSPTRCSRSARSPPRRPSSSSAPTAAASSTSTRRTPSRTPPRSRNFFEI